MFSLFKPTPATLRRVIAEQSALDFTYPAVGATANKSAMPEGLLKQLTLEQGAQLCANLNQPPDAHLTSRRQNNRQ